MCVCGWVGGGGLGVEQTINLNLTKFKAQNKISVPQSSSTPKNQPETLGCVVIGQYFYLVGGFDAHPVQFFKKKNGQNGYIPLFNKISSNIQLFAKYLTIHHFFETQL